MNTIALPRGGGKTTKLIEIAARTGDYIVTKDHITARYTADLAKKMGKVIHFPCTFEEFLRDAYSPRISGFLIDDADLLLMLILRRSPVPIHAMTISPGEAYYNEENKHE